MANKFLPFIVEKSPLDSIYQTMLSRSKGINTLTLLSVFHAVGAQGIKKVREYVDSQSSDLTTEQLYQSIANHFSNYAVDGDDYSAFYLLRYMVSVEDLAEGNDKFQGYSHADILGFILVATLIGKSNDYFAIDYDSYLKNYSKVTQNIPEYVNLADDSGSDAAVEVIELYDVKAVEAFILYKGLIFPESEKVFRIKLNKTEGDDDDSPF